MDLAFWQKSEKQQSPPCNASELNSMCDVLYSCNRFLFEVVHGSLFSLRRWEKFIKSRPVPGTGVSFAEIEVDLCNIPSREAIALEQLEEQREREGMVVFL